VNPSQCLLHNITYLVPTALQVVHITNTDGLNQQIFGWLSVYHKY